MICYEPSDLAKAEGQPQPKPTSPPDDVAVAITNPSPDAGGGGGEMNPVIRMLQERELGKYLLPSAIAIVGIVVAGKDRLTQLEISLVLILVCLGFTAILYGILLKDTHTNFAQIFEPLGIALVALSFFAVVGFFMPVELLWVPFLCFALLCLLPFIALLWPPATATAV